MSSDCLPPDEITTLTNTVFPYIKAVFHIRGNKSIPEQSIKGWFFSISGNISIPEQITKSFFHIGGNKSIPEQSIKGCFFPSAVTYRYQNKLLKAFFTLAVTYRYQNNLLKAVCSHLRYRYLKFWFSWIKFAMSVEFALKRVDIQCKCNKKIKAILYLTYWSIPSQFLVCDTSAAFSILMLIPSNISCPELVL